MPRLKTMKNPLLAYTLARLGIFAGFLAVLLLLRFAPIAAVIIATMLSVSVSLIFLRGLRESSSARIYSALNKPKKTADEKAED